MESDDYEENEDEEEESEDGEENEENDEEYAIEVMESARGAVSGGCSLDEAVAGTDNPQLASVVASQLYGLEEENEGEDGEDDESG